MIAYLEGPCRSLESDRVVVLAGGVGYLLNISLSTYYQLEGKSSVALEVHTHVREDALSLYGFATAQEKFAFEKLIGISGIGPRLAQVILSGIDPEQLADAILRADARRLSSIPGVGKKTSERIILELRDKLVFAERKETTKSAPRSAPSVDDDVRSALLNLGYKAASAEAAMQGARKELGEEAEFSRVLKTALRQLTR